MPKGSKGVLAVDGKTLRRSYDRAEQLSPLHPVSAWAEAQRLVLGQLAVDAKSDEITALRQQSVGNADFAGQGSYR